MNCGFTKNLKINIGKFFMCVLAFILAIGCMFTPGEFAMAETTLNSLNDLDEFNDQKRIDMLLHPDENTLECKELMRDYVDNEYGDPYATGMDKPFMMMEQDELACLLHQNVDKTHLDNIYGNYVNGNTGKVEDEFSTSDNNFKSSMPDEVNKMDAAHMVSFSTFTDQNPRKDHLGIIGYLDDNNGHKHSICMAVYNANSGKWSDILDIGEFDWIDHEGKTYYGDMEPYLSITAGDYNRDNIDTLVCYFANYASTNYGVCEYAVSDKSDGTPEINKTPISKDSSFNLLNKGFVGDKPAHDDQIANMDNIFHTSGHRAAGKGSLRATLQTGDFNGDNIDDVAVLSALEFEKKDQAQKCDWHLDVPYLAVCAGTANGNFLAGSPMFTKYVGSIDEDNHTAGTVNLENFTVARLGKHSCDSIIVGGNDKYFTGKVNNNGDFVLDSVLSSDNLAMARFDFDGVSSMKQTAYTIQYYNQKGDFSTMKINPFSTWGNYKSDYAWSPISAGTVYMNGKGNDPYILMDGDLYHWKEDANYPQRVFEFEWMNDYSSLIVKEGVSIDQNFCGIASTCAGNWDGNSQGYEQIVISLIQREIHSDDYYVSLYTVGLKSSAHAEDKEESTTDNAKTNSYSSNKGTPTAVTEVDGQEFDLGYSDDLFFWTKEKDNFNIKNKGSTRDHGMSIALCNMDYKNDGLCVRLHDKGLIYSDPVLECAIQATPYYATDASESDNPISEYGGATTNLSWKKTESKTATLSKEEKTSQGYSIGHNTTHEFLPNEIATVNTSRQTNLSAGSINGYSLKFSKTVGYSEEITWESVDKNVIEVSRYPILFYNYDVQNNADPNKWVENEINITNLTYNKAIQVGLTTAGYNTLVNQYNDAVYQARQGNSEEDPNDFIHLKPITDEDLTNNVGDPIYYKNALGNDKYYITGKTIPMTGGKDSAFLTFEGSNSWQKQRGLDFEYDKSISVGLILKPFNLMKRSGGFNFGKYKDYQKLWGVSDTFTQSLTATISFEVRGNSFESRVGTWKATGVPIKYHDDGKTYDEMPVYGYLLYGAETKEDHFHLATGFKGTYNPPNNNGEGKTNQETSNDKDSITNNNQQTEKTQSNDLQSGSSETTKPTANIVQKAYANDEKENTIKLEWEAPEGGKNFSYQLYTCVNGEIIKLGNPVKGTEFVFDINNPPESIKNIAKDWNVADWPIFQFAISTINDDGTKNAMSGWMYFLNSQYFKENYCWKVGRNHPESNERLTIHTKTANENFMTKTFDFISLYRAETNKPSLKFTFNGKNKNDEKKIETKDGSKYIVSDIKQVGEAGSDALYSISLANSSNSNDIKNFVFRLNDGRFSHERLIESKILSCWSSPQEVVAALNNPETYDTAAINLAEINKLIMQCNDVKLTEDAKAIYKAGMTTYININNPEKFNIWFVIVPVVLALLVAAFIILFIRHKKKAKSKK